MEPLSSYLTASAIWSGITALAGEIVVGRTEAGLLLRYEKIRANLNQYRSDGNHELERAVYRAYLQACMQTMIYHYGQLGYDAAGWVRWEVLPNWTADAVRRWRTQPYMGKTSESERQWIEVSLPRIRDVLASADQAEFIANLSTHPQLAAIREKYALLLRPPGGEAQLPDLRTPLVEGVLADLEQRNPGVPEGLADMIRTHWFDLFCGCFQTLFKNDDKVQAIVLGKLFAGLSVRQGDGDLTEFDIKTVNQRLLAGIEPALRSVLDEFTTRIESKIDERADRLEVELKTLRDRQLSALDILHLVQQLAPEGLTSPPARSAQSRAGNLPQRRTFVGRQDWLTIIGQRLRTDETITITSLRGVPGVGKSALALECDIVLPNSFRLAVFGWICAAMTPPAHCV
ncbi:MAG: hypothetical protein AB7P69_25920 [Candidatus Binatia bacterium]